MDDIKSFCDKFDNMVMTGHSLGGAVSVLFAASLHPAKVHSVHTFGSPPIGDADFQKLYKQSGIWDRTFRYITPMDPVVNSPIAYKHVGRKIILPYRDNSIWNHHDMKTYKTEIDELNVGEYIHIDSSFIENFPFN